MQPIITSVNNPLIKELRALKERKYRRRSGCFLIEGRRLIEDAVRNGIKPELLLVQDDRTEEFALLSEQCLQTAAVSRAVLESLCLTEAPEGAVAKVRIPQEMPEGDGSLVMVLDGLQDPGNMGTIIRTANAAGIRDIYFLGENVDMFNPKTVRSAMGAVFFVHPHYFGDARELYEHLKERGYCVCVTALSRKDYYSQQLPKKIALVMGNEGNGVSRESLEQADRLLTLPMSPEAESLNVAVCAGILIFDILYRR